MARFTIGIPTYNRARFLRRALEVACQQTSDDVEVLVSDNASTDDTESVVRSFGDRVRYHRNAENIGMWRNFIQVAELAGGEYLAWLQDDDLVHRDFARRALDAFDAEADIVMYTAYSFDSHSYDTFFLPLVLGPPIPMDWMGSRRRVVDGSIVAPISFFATFSMPPITAYRVEAIRPALKHVDPINELFNERVVQSAAVADGRVAVDPWPAGIFYKHPMQSSLLAGSLHLPERSRQWVLMANELSLMLERRPLGWWRPQLEEWMASVSSNDIIRLFYDMAPLPYWSGLRPLALEACSLILARIPEADRRRFGAGQAGQEKSLKGHVKHLGRQLTPPLLWDAMRKARGR